MSEDNREKKPRKWIIDPAEPGTWKQAGASEALEHWTGSMVNKKYQVILQQPPVPPTQPPESQTGQQAQDGTSTSPADEKSRKKKNERTE